MSDVQPVFQIAELPWLLPIWQKLIERIRQNRFPHALMLKGVSGLGKRLLADALAKRLLCMESAEVACGHCKSCQLIEAGSHSDLFVCVPEEDSKVIKVDQVRQLNDFVSQSCRISGVKVVIVDPAAALNQNSANALLKNLEEPTGRAIYLVLDHQAGNVLPTIRSRCQVVDIRPPAESVLFDWVNLHVNSTEGIAVTRESVTDIAHLASGAPLALLTLLQDKAHETQNEFIVTLAGVLKNKISPVDGAKAWLSLPVAKGLIWQISWLDAIVRYQLTNDLGAIKPSSAGDMFKFLAESVPAEALFALRKTVLETMAGLTSNLNESLLVENLLVQWKSLMQFRVKASNA